MHDTYVEKKEIPFRKLSVDQIREAMQPVYDRQQQEAIEYLMNWKKEKETKEAAKEVA